MSQTEIKNLMPFEFGLQHLEDLRGIPVAVAVTKATFVIESGSLHAAETQLPILESGKPTGERGKSSYQYEPECCYLKPNTDVVLIGSAIPPRGAATMIEVQFSVGPLAKRALVFGDRWWERGFTGPRLSHPLSFESVPLVYERAFGGWDCSNPDPNLHHFDRRNPVGTGFQKTFASGQDRVAVPNIEDPRSLVTTMASRPRPVGFGFTSPDWEPRASLAGTYDANWERTRMPLLPEDFDPRFFNAAPEGLVSNGYLNGDEPVMLSNGSAQPLLGFFLPGIRPPVCRFRTAGGGLVILPGALDTVVVNSIENIVILIWRCHIPLPRGPEQLLELQVGEER